MADFAEIGFCAYKGWHRGRGTEVRRPMTVQARVIAGEKVHVEKVAEELKASERLPIATPRELRNPRIDIARIPELPAWIKVGRLVYASHVERAGRTAGDLVITEIKTGSWTLMPDHFLQVWGYCMSAPGALLRETKSSFRARTIRWGLAYPQESFGPYPFTEKALRLVRSGMRHFERLYRAGMDANQEVPHDPYGPSARKCPKCAFSHACGWRQGQPLDVSHNGTRVTATTKRGATVRNDALGEVRRDIGDRS